MQRRNDRPFAKRSLGQNFLVDGQVVDKILDAFDPATSDLVLEIGPGRGALTERLVGRVKKLIALEFDRELIPVLREKFAGRGNFELIEDDALTVNFTDLAGGEKLRLIANLPYNISTAILQRLFDHRDAFSDCVLMFQREVMDRIAAPAGSSARGFLTVLTEAYFTSERLFDVSPSAFRPIPQVWSSVARLVPIKRELTNESTFRELVATAFVHKRKTILNNLKTGYRNAAGVLSSVDIDTRRRADTLTIEEWLRLSEAIDSEKYV